MDDSAFQRLQQQVDRLIDRCQTLQDDNQRLLRREQEWKTDRARLLQVHNQTEAKIEAMIQRLKALEQE